MNSIPTAPGALPLLGHLLPLVRDPFRFLTSLPEHGDLVRIRLGPTSAVVVCDPTLTRQVLRDDRVFDKGGLIIDRFRNALGDGLATSPYRLHRRQRRLIQPTFHSARLPAYTQAMATEIAEIVRSWRDGQVLDVPAETTVITSTALAATLFSTALPVSARRQACEDVTALFAGTFRLMVVPPPLDRLPTRGHYRYQRAHARLRRTLDSVIADRRADGADCGDLLSALLSARDSDGDSLNDTEIADQVLTFFLAGTETTANVLAWAVHLLAEHPAIEHRLHVETDIVLGRRPVAPADLPRLPLAARVITEALRLFPPGWVVTRVVTTDTELGRHRLPTGTTVVYSPYVIHHQPDLYPDPDRFDPDRWLPERAAVIPRDACIPFGGGARKCIADQFGFAEAVLALATIAAHWRLVPLPSGDVRPGPASALRPRRLRMRVIARIPDLSTTARETASGRPE